MTFKIERKNVFIDKHMNKILVTTKKVAEVILE